MAPDADPDSDPSVSFRCPEDLIDRLDEQAEEMGIDRSTLLRWIVEYAVEADSGTYAPFPFAE